VEYSRDYYLLRVEALVSHWTLPLVDRPHLDLPVAARAVSIEGRYKLLPGVYAAARFDHLGFSEVTGTSGSLSWDAPVTRYIDEGKVVTEASRTAHAASQSTKRFMLKLIVPALREPIERYVDLWLATRQAELARDPQQRWKFIGDACNDVVECYPANSGLRKGKVLESYKAAKRRRARLLAPVASETSE